MRRFHIVAVTRDLHEALVIQTSAGWLLPCLDDNPGAELPAQVHALLTRVVDKAEMIHEAPLAYDDATTGTTHACIVALVGDDSTMGSRRSNQARLQPIADLLSGRALLPLQLRAFVTSLARLQSPQAPFDSGDRVAAALAWVDEQIASQTGIRSRAMTRHRCARHEYVVACQSGVGMMYFKGGRDRVADEATLTQLLWTLSPRRFPETVAIDHVNHRWLYRALPGELLSGARLTSNSAAAAVRTLARVQQLAMDSPSVEAHLADRRLDGVGLFEHVDRIIQRACSIGSQPGWTSPATMRHRLTSAPNSAHDDARRSLHDRWRATAGQILSTCTAVDALHLPRTLVLSDFWSHNILQTSSGIGFIDLEQSYWTYPLLSLWKFVTEVERHVSGRCNARGALQQAFIDEWSGGISVGTMARALEYLPAFGRLFGILLASRELDLEERGLGEALPTGYRARHLSKYVERCLEEAAPVRP